LVTNAVVWMDTPHTIAPSTLMTALLVPA